MAAQPPADRPPAAPTPLLLTPEGAGSGDGASEAGTVASTEVPPASATTTAGDNTEEEPEAKIENADTDGIDGATEKVAAATGRVAATTVDAGAGDITAAAAVDGEDITGTCAAMSTGCVCGAASGSCEGA